MMRMILQRWGLGALALGGISTPVAHALPPSRQIDVALEAPTPDKVVVLPNGNIVVVDADFSTPTATNAGAVWLYRPDGTLISRLTGAYTNDRVGLGALVVLSDGNFVVGSPNFRESTPTCVLGFGAMTWVDGTLGLNATVGASNSLLGMNCGDTVGSSITALTEGDYLIWWSAGGAGALTRAHGRATGRVSC